MRDTNEPRSRWAGLTQWTKARQSGKIAVLEAEASKIRLEVFDRMVERRIKEICDAAREQ